MGHVCPSWLSCILYNPLRKAFTDRRRIFHESGITPGSVVLEVGAGNGFFTEVLAEEAQKVYAVELQEGMVRKLRKRVSGLGEKVVILRCDISSCRIGDEFADVCFMYYCFHEIDRKAEAVGIIGKAVKRGGILSIYEPTTEVNQRGMEKCLTMFEDAGFRKEMEWKRLFTRFARLRKVENSEGVG